MRSVMLLLAAAAPISGDWDGALTVPAGIKIPLILHLGDTANTIDSPDQNATGVPIEVTRTDAGVTVRMPKGGAEFDGMLSADGKTLAGPFKQGGMTMTAQFQRRPPGAPAPGQDRPQTPKPPFPYDARDVSFPSPAGTLAGTLTVPKGAGPFPAVVLIAGSGPQNRDETVDGHRIFLVLADHLTRAGIAVLRYDKRGVGESKGSYGTATQADFTADARTAFEWLRGQPAIDPKHMGVIGHSEGAEIAPVLANSDPHVAFAVLLSAPAEPGVETIASQQEAINRAMGMPADIVARQGALERALLDAVRAAPDEATARAAAIKILEQAGMPPDKAAQQATGVASPWFRAFLDDDPAPALRKMSVPTLVVAGSKDLQVLPDRNLPIIRAAMAGKKDITIVELPGLNHILQPATTGTPAEYGRITITIDPAALDLIGGWIVNRVEKSH